VNNPEDHPGLTLKTHSTPCAVLLAIWN